MYTVVQSGTVELPEDIARRLEGRRVEFRENEAGIVLVPIDDPIASLRGILKGKGPSTEDYFRQKQEDKLLEP